ncbi:MAG: UDP-N-acetylglucosamine--N-acetylmuramyl-(pentapeptide) pyrophosphoryl-undecaprenol N-acetylglucosamine transferase [Acidimicrobiales bacterium]
MASGDPSLVIAAGGTGGHIYPGLALARAVSRASPRARVSFVGTRRGLEQRVVPGAGFELDLLDMVPFAGWGRVTLPVALVRASVQARRVLRRRRAGVAVGMGGYTTAPLVTGARLAGVPSLVHESGAVPGRANLVAARVCTGVATALPSAAGAFGRSTTVRNVGMPLAPELEAFDRERLRPSARRAWQVSDATTLVLVIGGSQGAVTLNRLAVGLARRWRGRTDIRILLKAGSAHLDRVAEELSASGAAHVVEATAYIDRMDHAYAAADVAVCRAGAGTVAELAVVGLPSVLVPYPHAPHDHQARNASDLVAAGGAVMVRDAEATPEIVGPLLEGSLTDGGTLARMRAALTSLARPRAAEELAAWALELAAG